MGKKKKALTSLENFKAGEVSIVDRGANKKKRFPIFKQEKDPMSQEEMETILKAVLETEIDEEKTLEEMIAKASISEKGKSAAKAALRILSGFKDEMPPDLLKALGELTGVGKACAPDHTELEEKVKKLETENAELKEGEAVDKSEDVKEVVEVPEAIQKRFDDLEAENKALKESNEAITKALTDQKEAAELATWEAKAKAELAYYPGKSFEEIAKSLHELAKVNAELAENHFVTMKAASDALKESEVFKSAGNRGQTTEGSAMAKIEKMASDILANSSDLNMTKEKAIAKVLRDRPDLYDADLAENEQG
jgi:hypothetical protein